MKKMLIIMGLTHLFLGYLFYASIRSFDPLGIVGIYSSYFDAEHSSFTLVFGSLPSLLHVLIFSLLSVAFMKYRSINIYLAVGFWILINILFELLQYPFNGSPSLIPGVTDSYDVLFAIVGGLVAVLIVKLVEKQVSCKKQCPKPHSRFAFSLVIASGVFLSLGSVLPNADPIYMSYEELRGPLIIESEKPLSKAGKIYKYQDLLFVNEPNQGIHVYDNSDPEAPEYLGFLVIPGNLDISVKDYILYADSYIDLVAIDLNNPEDINMTHRIEGLFPYNEFQNIDNEESVYFSEIDKSKGVVIGFERRNSLFP